MDRYQHDNLSNLLRIIADRLTDNVSGGTTLADVSEGTSMADLNLALAGILAQLVANDSSISGVLGLDSAARDSFSRYRVSNPTTIFDSKLTLDNAPLLWDEDYLSGSGVTSTWSKPKASVTLTSTANVAANYLRRTFQRFNYQPGKGSLVDMTFVAGESEIGRQVVVGQFDEANGIFVRDNEGTIEWVIRSSRSGSPEENAKAKGAWNIDNFDGTGPSGITLDFTQNQIIIIDYQWLGVGRVRVGFDIDGKIFYAHEFNHANTTAGVYMSTPNLPLTYQLITTTDTPATSLECICSTVISEGGTNEIGYLRYVSTNGDHLDADVADTWYALLGVRLKSTHLGATVKLQGISVLCESQDSFEWAIFLNPTVSGSPTWTAQTSSAVETAVGQAANTITYASSIGMTGGVVKASATSGDVNSGLDNAIVLGSAINGTLDEIWLGVRPLTSNADFEGTFSWREIV